MRGLVHRHPVLSFFVLAYTLSWGWWVPMVLAGEVVHAGSAYPTHLPGLLGPVLAALAVTALQQGTAGVRHLVLRMCWWPRRSFWTVIAVIMPVVVLLLVAASTAALGRPPRLNDLGVMNGLPAMNPFAMWLVLVLCSGFGEETGWRGYALPHLQRRYGTLPGTLLLAVGWAVWHVPTFFMLETYRTLGLAMLPGFVLGLTAGAVLLTWLYNRSGASILAVALWHGSFNLVTATRAAQGLLAAIVSTVVMTWGISLAVAELRAWRRGAPSVLV